MRFSGEILLDFGLTTFAALLHAEHLLADPRRLAGTVYSGLSLSEFVPDDFRDGVLGL